MTNAGNLKAFATATIEDAYAIHGIRVVQPEGKDVFVAMPSRKTTNDEGQEVYVDIFHPVTSEARQELVDAVLTAYNAAE